MRGVSRGIIDQAMEYLADNAKIEDCTSQVSLTMTTGSSKTINACYKYGKIVVFDVSVSRGAATAAGSNVFAGVLSPAKFRPKTVAPTTTYYGSSGILAQIDNSGNVAVRVIGAQLAANSTVRVCFTYLVN